MTSSNPVGCAIYGRELLWDYCTKTSVLSTHALQIARRKTVFFRRLLSHLHMRAVGLHIATKFCAAACIITPYFQHFNVADIRPAFSFRWAYMKPVPVFMRTVPNFQNRLSKSHNFGRIKFCCAFESHNF